MRRAMYDRATDMFGSCELEMKPFTLRGEEGWICSMPDGERWVATRTIIWEGED